MGEPQIIRLMPSGEEVEYRAQDTVLEALERAGYPLPNNCRAGACGECKAKVLDGAIDQGIVMRMALTEQEWADGYALTCVARSTSPTLGIHYDTVNALPRLFPPRKDARFVVTDRILRTPRILEIQLNPLGENLRFWPGQYVMIGDLSNEVPARQYSIANAPRRSGELRLLVAHASSGITSSWIHEKVKPGMQVRVDGPYGTFVGDPAVESPVLCLAAGSGLAPILSLAEAALRRGFQFSTTLVFSARHATDVFDAGQMAFWMMRHRRFQYVVCRTGDGELAPGEHKGRIPLVLPDLFDSLERHSVFIAGPPGFVTDCHAACERLGARPELIWRESFYPQVKADPPDSASPAR
ncbi:MAG: 2Fe-2S iron-sulfur cluster-binding protein [Streptosporangiaceae bacterium]